MKKKTVRKEFRLDEHSIEIIHQIMKDKSLSSEKEAITYCLKQYEEKDQSYELIAEEVYSKLKNDLTRLRLGIRTAEHNSIILMDLANSYLHNNPESITYIMYNDGELKSDLVKECENHLAKKITKAKQTKDNSKLQRGEE